MNRKIEGTDCVHDWVKTLDSAAYNDGLSVYVSICSKCRKRKKIEFDREWSDILLFPIFVVLSLILGALASVIILIVVTYTEAISPFLRKRFN